MISILGIFAAFNCVTFSEQLESPKEGNLKFVSAKDYSLFLNKDTKEFYLLQTKSKVSIPKNSSFVEFSEKRGLVIRDKSGTITYTLGENIYGIAHMKGKEFVNALTVNSNGNLNFIPNVGTVIFELACGCVSNGTTSDCDSGGAGSNGCSVTDGGSVGIGWNNGCSVSCNEGYYACCNE